MRGITPTDTTNQAKRLHKGGELVLKRFQLLGTAEEMTGVETTFVEWHNDRMEVRRTFIQVHPLSDNAPRMLLPEPPASTVEEG
jgi:hypothetical protein